MTTLLSPDEDGNAPARHCPTNGLDPRAGEILPESGVPIDVKVVWHNRPFEAIIQEVVGEKHDLLLKMAHQHDKLEAVIFTPTDWHLLRKCPCPVWMVKDQPWPERAAKRWSPSISPARIITTPLTRSWVSRTPLCRWRKKSTTLKCT